MLNLQYADEFQKKELKQIISKLKNVIEKYGSDQWDKTKVMIIDHIKNILSKEANILEPLIVNNGG